MMFAWSPLSQKRRSVTWLMLLVLAGVNSVLAWHQAAHAFEQLAIEASSNPAQTAAQLDDHCGLCLSAHGYNSGPTSFLPVLPAVPAQFHWIAPTLPTLLVAGVQRPQARAPPALLPL
jgi:hypothetical protein